MKAINPYLLFNGNAEEAFTFYQSVFGGELQIVRFKDMGDTGGMTEEDMDKLAHVSLPLSGSTQILMASDAPTGREVNVVENANFFVTLETESADEADRVYKALTDGGQVFMPLEETEWAERYSMFADKFGIQWMINYTGSKA